MEIADAQRDVRATYVGGSFGQLASGALWLGAAAEGTWASEAAEVHRNSQRCGWFAGMVLVVFASLLRRDAQAVDQLSRWCSPTVAAVRDDASHSALVR